MKRIFYILFLLLSSSVYCQITTPIIEANFGLDGDLRANFLIIHQLIAVTMTGLIMMRQLPA